MSDEEITQEDDPQEYTEGIVKQREEEEQAARDAENKRREGQGLPSLEDEEKEAAKAAKEAEKAAEKEEK